MFDGCCPPRFTLFLQPAWFRCWLHAQLSACHRGSFPILINPLDIHLFPLHSFFCFLSRYFLSFSCLLCLLESLILLPQVYVASSIASRLTRFTTHFLSPLFKKAQREHVFNPSQNSITIIIALPPLATTLSLNGCQVRREKTNLIFAQDSPLEPRCLFDLLALCRLLIFLVFRYYPSSSSISFF